MKVIIKKSTNTKKKYMAVFTDENKKKIKTTHFGAAGMSDYTKHKDEKRKKRYMNRHRTRENWSQYMTAGSLSRWILWNKPSFRASVSDYKRRFKLQ
jgi:hypothetical protein|tara:strand:+ start:146 stop:436 length:291 start_codon:yes stop_codon:yes gene_type:complete